MQLNDDMNQIVWKLKKNGEFAVKSFHNHLVGRHLEGVVKFPAKQIWKVKAPLRITSFAWEVGR